MVENAASTQGGEVMPVAMPVAMLTGCSEQSTQRNATDGRNVRHQDPEKSSSVPDRAEPVDNGEAVQQFIHEHALEVA
jgi:hypothetical protein